MIISALFVVSVGACGGSFSGCGCATTPLPGGALPATQTVEGGAQIRVTPSGFTKLTSLIPGAFNAALGGGVCIPEGSVGLNLGVYTPTATWCSNNDGTCTKGCKLSTTVNSTTLAVTDSQTLDIKVDISASTTVPIDNNLTFFFDDCSLNIVGNHLKADISMGFAINATTGELELNVSNVNNLDISGLSFSSNGGAVCDAVAGLGSFVSFVGNIVGQYFSGILTPIANDLVQSFLPNPLGIEGVVDVGALLASVSPSTEAKLETRLVPGGYVGLQGSGMSLGLITGFNSDADPTTRTGALASEPSLCVPPLTAPDFSGPPWSLPTTTRGTFALSAAGEFSGAPDPAGADFAVGLSQTTLDQIGHHAVTSGAVCLQVGTSYIKQLNVGTIGLLVPSLAELESAQGNDPLLLVTRPQRAIDFTIGDNTTASPALTIGLSHLEVDFYAFLYERYVRAFTLDLTMNIGVNLDFEQMTGMPATIKPTLVGINASSVTLTVLNSEFVAETPAHLEMVLPSVFNLVTPLLGNLPDITVPSFAGFSLNNLSIQHVTTTQDDFLALYASLGASTAMRVFAQNQPYAKPAVDALDAQMTPAQPPSTGMAHLRGVHTPDATTINNALLGTAGGALPTITFDTDELDTQGRKLEWSWNLNGGMWRPYTSGATLAITDPALAWQGKYIVGLKSRVVGDYRTVVYQTPVAVTVDSVGPRIMVDQATSDGDTMTIPGWDVVSGTALKFAIGKPNAPTPSTAWVAGSAAKIAQSDIDRVAVNGQISLFAQDETGNQTVVLITPFHGTTGGVGCSGCSTGGPGAGGGALIVLVAIGMLSMGRRRDVRVRIARILQGGRGRAIATVLVWAGASVAMSLQPGCSCGKSEDKACEVGSDCGADFCPAGQLPFCVDNTCVCSDDIPIGRVGPYSQIATGGDGSIWVSAYAQTYGDLVVAQVSGPGRISDNGWQWVDGVPAGPVTVPGSMIRGGVSDNGPDVGMYTSIKVAPDGTPMVSYFDVDGGSLKFAALVGGVWQMHVVEQGTTASLAATATSGTVTGMYTSMSLRADNGFPGIAYLAHVADSAGIHAEVRYAEAQVAVPMSAADWKLYTVDTAAVVADPNDVFPLPEGLGLFIDSTHLPSNAPVVVYYDRAAGELKMSTFTSAGAFGTPVVLAGSSGIDEGWTPSVAVDSSGMVNVAYVNANAQNLNFLDTMNTTPVVVDNGYRIVGTTVDGLPKPTFDFVGANAQLVLPSAIGPVVVYQDATTQELLMAQRSQDGTSWPRTSLAGAAMPWDGAYGFFASAALDGGQIAVSTWVIDQPTQENWVEVFVPTVQIQ